MAKVAAALKTAAMVLDEPTMGLGPEEDVVTLRLLVRQASRAGAAVLLSTRDPAFAERACDRLFLVDGGRLLASGTPASLLERYGAESMQEVLSSAIGIGRPTNGS